MTRVKVVLSLTALAACLSTVVPVAKEHSDRSVAITNVRIFDGERMIPNGTVVIEGQTISYVGKEKKIPEGAEVIEGAGATLLPGLIDSHAHDQGFGVERALVFGVTTELEMFW